MATKKERSETRRAGREDTVMRCWSPLGLLLPFSPCFFFFQAEDGIRDRSRQFLLNRSSDLIKDECSRLLEASTMKSRRGFAIQRLMNAMRQAHADGWFIVFDTLTLADDRLEAFYDNPNALRDYFRDIGRMVLAA